MQGTAFFALQSCANHSCVPTAAIEGESSGEACILALRDIKPGQEVTISYIDVEDSKTGVPLGYRERRRMLKDYGFECDCELCARQRAQRANAAAARGKGRANIRGKR